MRSKAICNLVTAPLKCTVQRLQSYLAFILVREHSGVVAGAVQRRSCVRNALICHLAVWSKHVQTPTYTRTVYVCVEGIRWVFAEIREKIDVWIRHVLNNATEERTSQKKPVRIQE